MKKEVSILVSDESYLPTYASEKAAGADIRAAILEDISLNPGESRLIPTGIFLEIPTGYEVQIRPRSGLALKHGVTIVNSPGTIDADYRGEVGVILINHGKAPFLITPKMRIAQMVLAPVFQAVFRQKEELTSTARGALGFGHSGTH